jgi:peptide/nickel transport system ATP-binding protein
VTGVGSPRWHDAPGAGDAVSSAASAGAPGDPTPDQRKRPDPSPALLTSPVGEKSATDLEADSVGRSGLVVKDLRTHIRMRTATVQAVDAISFDVPPGQTVGLVGESGCGKSMTALSIMRLLPPGGRIAGGSITLDGRELTSLPQREMRRIRGNEIAMIFQDPLASLDPTMTIGEHIAESVREHKHVSKRAALDRAAEVLELVGMPKPTERLRSYPHQLSGGLRQRVTIAMALACEPKVLIADEPTTALDVTIQSQILALLDDLKDRLNLGLLLITHDLGVIAGRADRVLVMYAGRIVEQADTSALFAEHRHPYTEALLQSTPDLRTDRTTVLYSIPGLPPDLAKPPPGCRFAPRCRYSRPECVNEEPELAGDTAGHTQACFFPVTGGGERSSTSDMWSDQVGPGADGQQADAAGAPSPGQGPQLVLSHVTKEFPITKGLLQRQIGSIKAVSDVSFEVARGETFGLVGESGCGKTTLGRLITAMERSDSGSVTFDGEDLNRISNRRLRQLRRNFQLMFQDSSSSFDPRMRISSSLREPMSVQRVGSRKTQQDRIQELLGEVGLASGSAARYPHELSGGQRQRLGLARALTLDPQLIVADEPVSALDVSVQSQVLNLMRGLQARRSLTLILISHDLSVVRYMADRVGIMYLGKLVEIGGAPEVYERPAHPYTAGLLEAVPTPDPSIERHNRVPAVKGELPSAADPPSGCRFRTRCPRAQSLCAEQEPLMRAFHVSSHQAACHFPLQPPLDAKELIPERSSS